MRTIIFEIRGQVGHFRKPYAPVSPVTYPFPPPPTIIGIIGAICGYGKDEYAEKIGWDKVCIAVSLLAPVKRFRAGLNLINTKGNKYFRLVGESPRTQIPYEFLKDPAYRIFVANANDETMDRLSDLLKNDKTVYTPSLGLAQCLATVSCCGEMEASDTSSENVEVNSVVPMEQVREIHYEVGRRYTRFRIPERMRTDRTVEKYGEVVVDEGANKITVETSQAFKVGKNYVLFSDCLAHPPDDYLKDHLKSVAMANKNIWRKGSNAFAIAGILSGLLHDIGKANRWFQDRVNGKDKRRSSYSNHSLPSAVIGWYISSAINLDGQELHRVRLSVFISILRHHTNLKEPWADEVMLLKQRLKSTDENHLAILNAQLNSMDLKGIEGWIKEVVKEFELPLTVPELKPELITKAITSARPLRLQNSFKTLEDVIDFLGVYGGLLQFDKIHSAAGIIERERFYLPENSTQKYIKECIPQQSGKLVKIRNNLSDELERELLTHFNEHFFTLTAPTGSGKTLAVLNAVLKLRKYIEGKEGVIPSIIYCLPFTSIIDQNHAVYREVLENAGLLVNSELLLKHHHLSDPVYISSDPEFDPDDSALFTETWQSELVVTTFYQLLNGIITPRNKNLKRFVSLKDAIVIMDEVQAIPHRYWEPIRNLFQIIGNRLNTRFILMTATQPLLFTNDMAVELLPEHEKYFEQLSRIKLVNRTDSDTHLEDFFTIIANELQKNPNQSRMCVLNRKSSVRKLYSMFKESLPDRNVYALSTNLTPKDRKKRIEEIRESLKSGVPCLIITTQLVEAGVDISVDVVDRDMAPLDSIIQSAGRCNRHGSEIKGIVNLWSFTDDGKLWKKVYDPFLIDATSEVLVGKTLIEEKEFLDLGRNYFKLICKRSNSENIDNLLKNGRFSEIEANFKLIEDDGPRQSYFIIQSQKDRKIWEQYGKLGQIEDLIKRKRTFGKFKAEFMERIIQVYVRSREEGIVPIESNLGLYTEELGFLGDISMPGSVIL